MFENQIEMTRADMWVFITCPLEWKEYNEGWQKQEKNVACSTYLRTYSRV